MRRKLESVVLILMIAMQPVRALATVTPHEKDFATLDKNSDGKLSAEEMAAAPEHAGTSGAGGTSSGSTSSGSGAASGSSESTGSKY